MNRAGRVVAIAMVLGCGGMESDEAGIEPAELGASRDSLTVESQLAAVRRATARYHDVENALADGFVAASPCEESSRGTMGFHYVNISRVLDPALDAEEPEALLYLPSGHRLRLVAVEYLLPIVLETGPYFGCGTNDNSCPPENPPPAPTIFAGHPFDGPMAGHNASLPWHYDQHVWVWAPNPSGMFAAWNPRLSCGDAEE